MRRLSFPVYQLMLLACLLVILLFALLTSRPANADPRTDCPQGPCKVITLNAEEERALIGTNMVFDTAVAGRQIDLFGVVAYFRSKIAQAPAGDTRAPEPPPQSSIAK